MPDIHERIKEAGFCKNCGAPNGRIGECGCLSDLAEKEEVSALRLVAPEMKAGDKMVGRKTPGGRVVDVWVSKS